ncbi:uncharacterized protein CDV56_101587 [Aspergillus thermomutatus]|uniref:SnoaL-like domain-containing protein n=1 Tax=Aspergillus thermomutatus TaxID=41047 RepID=A0A397G3J3_ASPTH|nr:uncharacterized protein CDV56_101587 [Aspergillus thermomutatus]RHZ45197.1 hypothetical protein CDV56_101587 [Aspergillus thermomutatus]
MAPSPTEIKAIFDAIYQGGIAQNPFSQEPERLERFLSPHAEIHIVGQEFPLAIQSNSLDAVIENVARPWHNLLDPNKPSTSEVIRVIGGGSDSWAALDCKTTATTKAGKLFHGWDRVSPLMANQYRIGEPFLHEFAYLLHFDGDGKISEIKGFVDTLNIHNHLVRKQ